MSFFVYKEIYYQFDLIEKIGKIKYAKNTLFLPRFHVILSFPFFYFPSYLIFLFTPNTIVISLIYALGK